MRSLWIFLAIFFGLAGGLLVLFCLMWGIVALAESITDSFGLQLALTLGFICALVAGIATIQERLENG